MFDLNRPSLKDLFVNGLTSVPVRAAPAGRFVIPVPDFKDGKGPILFPNIKEMEARLQGSQGYLKALELEAGPQIVPTDGTQVIIINRVDKFVQLALNAKLHDLIKEAGSVMTRDVVEDFLSYARGYSFDAASGKILFSHNAGFRNDVYPIPMDEFKQRYVSYTREDLSLENIDNDNLRSGFYMKAPLNGRAIFIEGTFKSRNRSRE
jgi:hypothetical protein